MTRTQPLGILTALLTLVAGLLLVCSSAWFITATALTGLGIFGLQGYNIFLPSACIRFLALAKPFSRYFEKMYNHKITFDRSSSSREWLFGKIAHGKKPELLKFRSAQLVHGLVNDIEELDHLFLGILLPWISTGMLFLLAVPFFIIVLPVMVWVLAVILLTAGFIIPLQAYKGGESREKESLSLKLQIHMGFTTMLRGFADLRQFGLLNAKRELLLREVIAEQRLRSKSRKTLAIWQLVQLITLQAALIVSIAIVLNHTDLDGPVLVLTVIGLISIFEGFLPFPALAHQYTRTKWCGSRLCAWENIPQSAQAIGKLVFPSEPDIQIDELSTSYDTHKVFDGLTLRFPARSITAVTGCNGCGKSTLLDVLCGLKTTIRGNIFIGGKRLGEIDPDELINHIGYMEQQATIFNVSLLQNIALARPDATDREVFDAAVRAGLGPTLEGYPDFLQKQAGESGKNISGGQARMIALARIILKDAPLLLLDEPTEGLDSNAEQNLINLIASWKGTKTVVLVTHKAGLLSICDYHQRLN